MTQLRVWQAMPQGWIEFAAQGESEQNAWWDDYLRSGEGWLPDDAREALTEGYKAGCAFFGDKDFDFAGIAIALGDSPFVTVMCTRVLRSDDTHTAQAGLGMHTLLPVLRFGEDAVAEPFQAEDGRTGTVTTATVVEGASTVVVAIGEIRLPDESGNVVVLGTCTDPERRDYLALHAAFALSTTRLLPDGELPPRPADLTAGE